MWKTSNLSLLLMKKIVEGEYKSQVNALIEHSRRRRPKCMVSIYSSEVCSSHAEMIAKESAAKEMAAQLPLHDLNQMPDTEPIPEPVPKLGSKYTITSTDKVPEGYSALWPPCYGVPNIDTDPFERLFVSVRLSIRRDKDAVDKCFDCISKRLEVFFINFEGQRYFWMT